MPKQHLPILKICSCPCQAGPNAAREFLGYELDRDKNGNFKASYPDRDNHTIDAVRYATQDDQINVQVR